MHLQNTRLGLGLKWTLFPVLEIENNLQSKANLTCPFSCTQKSL